MIPARDDLASGNPLRCLIRYRQSIKRASGFIVLSEKTLINAMNFCSIRLVFMLFLRNISSIQPKENRDAARWG